jgi:hypothetical protein
MGFRYEESSIGKRIAMISEPLPGNVLEKAKQIHSELQENSFIVTGRLTYVLNRVAKHCGFSCRDWYTAIEGPGFCELSKVLQNKKIITKNIIFEGLRTKDDFCFDILIGNKIFYAFEELPQRWLFEDFEAELKRGVELSKRKAKEKQRLISKAYGKLTKKEKLALGIPL